MLVWKFGSLFESYLDFIWGEFKFELNSNLNQLNSLRDIGKRHCAPRAANLPFRPAPLSAR
jgi:hypothetical protein